MSQTPYLTFNEDTEGIQVDLDSLLVHKLAVAANSGSGKSWLLRTLLEGTHGSVQHFITDPEDEYRTLREVFEDYLILGVDGDLSVTAATVGSAVSALVPAGVNIILDLYEYPQEEREAVCAAAVNSLIQLKRDAARHLLVVCDEVQLLAPQTGGSGASLKALTDLSLRGRKRGLGLIIATGRLALANNNLLAMCSNRVFGMTTLGNDLKRAGEELGFGARERDRLRKLSQGEFLAFGPAISQEVVKVKTLPVKSTHPAPGSVVPPTPPAGEALSKLLRELQLGEPSETDVEPDEDKRDILQSDKGAQARVREIKRLEARVRSEVARREGQDAEIQTLQERIAELTKRLKEIHTLSHDSAASPLTHTPAPENELKNEDKVAKAKPQKPVKAATRLLIKDAHPVRLDDEGSFELSKKAQRFIDTLASLHVLKLKSVPREIAAALSKQSHRSSAYTALVTELHKTGLLTYPAAGHVALTAQGLERAAPVARPITNELLQSAWLRQLDAYEGALAKEVLAAHPDMLSRDELSVATGYSAKSSRFAAALTKLRKFGLVKYPATGMVSAGPNYFLTPEPHAAVTGESLASHI